MDRMKIFLLGTVCLALLSGCLTQNQPPQGKGDIALELNQTAVAPDKGLISASGNDKLSVVTIKAQNASGGRWQFPLSAYEDEFGGVGLYSDSFIQLNRSHIKWLDEGEAIWLTPMIRGDDSAVLFNAVYSNDIANRSDVANCSEGTVRILGKTYRQSALINGSGFEQDDKWKVALEGNGSCESRIIIYMDGYFSDLGDGDQIPLFRNDNTVLFAFERSDNTPQVKIIATSPASDTTSYKDEGAAGPVRAEGNWSVSAGSVMHEERLVINEEGIRIEFEPALEAAELDMDAMSAYYTGAGIYTYALDSHGNAYERYGKVGWGLAWFHINVSDRFLGLNRVASSWWGPSFDAMDNASDFSETTDSVLIAGKRYVVGTPSSDGSGEARFCLVENRTDDSFDFCGGSYDLELPEDKYVELDDGYYYVHSGYSYAGQPFAYVIRYEIVRLYPDVEGVQIDWSGAGYPDGGLEAISASRQSAVFRDLTGQG